MRRLCLYNDNAAATDIDADTNAVAAVAAVAAVTAATYDTVGIVPNVQTSNYN